MAGTRPSRRVGERGSRPVELGDLAAALGLLTRLPVRVDADRAAARGARAAWAYPLVGGLVGGLAGLGGWAAFGLGLPMSAAALVGIALQIALTGALHEDGLADLADGIGGGATRERRLAIMRDSRIGTYGALALILTVCLRWSLLTAPIPTTLPLALAAAGALSRAGMALAMAALPSARPDGLAAAVGRPGAVTTGLAALAGLAVAGASVGPGPAFAAALGVAVAAAGVVALASAKLGGRTGDVLGAAQQTGEVAALVALVGLA